MKVTKRHLSKIIREEITASRSPHIRRGRHSDCERQLRNTIREIYLSDAEIINEGILDFFSGIFKAVLALFGVEIKEVSTETYNTALEHAKSLTTQTAATGSTDTQTALTDKKTGKPLTWDQLDIKNPTHKPVITQAANWATKQALKGMDVSLQGMMNVPPIRKKPTSEDDKAAMEQYKTHEKKMKIGARALGNLVGTTKFLGTKYPEFKKLHSQVEANPPTAPVDIFYQAGALAKAMRDSKVFGAPVSESRRHFANKLLAVERRLSTALNEAESEYKTEIDVDTELSVIVDLAQQYFATYPNTGVKNVGSLGKLPSTSMKGDPGKAATAAQAKAKEEEKKKKEGAPTPGDAEPPEVTTDVTDTIDWSKLDRAKFASQPLPVIAGAMLLMPEELMDEVFQDLNMNMKLLVIASLAQTKTLPEKAIRQIGKALGMEFFKDGGTEKIRPVLGVKPDEFITSLLKRMPAEVETSIFKNLQVNAPDLAKRFGKGKAVNQPT